MTVLRGFARIAEYEIESRPDACLTALARGLIHVWDALVAFVHSYQHLFRGGFRAEADVPHAASPEKPDLLVRHAAEEIGRGLKGPAKTSAGREKSPRDLHGAARVNQEVRVQQSHFFNAVTRDQLRDFPHDALGVVSIEAAVIEYRVGAVVAGVRAADAGGVRQFPLSTGLFVQIEIGKIIRRGRQIADARYGAVRVVPYLPVLLEGTARHSSPPLQSAHDLQKRDLALIADHDIHKRFLEGLLGEETRMPPAQHHRQVRASLFDPAPRGNGAADHGTGEKRNAEAERIRNLPLHRIDIIGNHRGIDDLYLVP